jgi:hypothetical protein
MSIATTNTTLFESFKPLYRKLTPCFVEDGASDNIESFCKYIEGLSDSQLSLIKGTLLMLVTNAPKKFERLRSLIRKRHIEIEDTKISAFFNFELKHDDEEDEEIVQDVFENLFNLRFRVPNLYKIFSWHPTYLESMSKLMNNLMWSEGPLLMPVRHYLAIIASSRYSCRNIAANHMLQFLKVGGDERWLEGVHRTSEKIQALIQLNALLAHQPWMIREKHIKELITGKNAWGISELVNAIVILSMFHSLCALSYGLGVIAEPDIMHLVFTCSSEGGLARDQVSTTSPIISRGMILSPPQSPLLSPQRYVDDTELKKNNNNSTGSSLVFPDTPKGTSFKSLADLEAARLANSQTEFSPNVESERRLVNVLTRDIDRLRRKEKAEPVEKTFESAAQVEPTTVILSSTSSSSSSSGSKKEEEHSEDEEVSEDESRTPRASSVDSCADVADLQRFSGNFSMQYIDYFVSQKAHRWCKVFRAQDYSWDKHCYAILSRFNPKCADLLDELFRTIYSLTYNTLGTSTEEVDTEPLRQGVWYYAQSIFGVRNDDFDYRQINIVMKRPLKNFVHKVVCHPETITEKDWQFQDALTPSERCHIALIAASARTQASLMYTLRAVHKAMM